MNTRRESFGAKSGPSYTIAVVYADAFLTPHAQSCPVLWFVRSIPASYLFAVPVLEEPSRRCRDLSYSESQSPCLISLPENYTSEDNKRDFKSLN